MPEWLYQKILVARYLNEFERRLYDAVCDKDRNAADLGANRGAVATELARRSRHVWAYEPHPKTFASLERFAPSNCTSRRAALSDQPGTATLRTRDTLGEEDTGHASLVSQALSDSSHAYEVPLVRLDDEDVSDLAFVKIDVEGHEAAALRGAAETIRRDRPRMWIEIDRQHHENADASHVHELLADLGYVTYFRWNDQWVDGKTFDPEKHQPMHDGKRAPGERVIDFLCEPEEINRSVTLAL